MGEFRNGIEFQGSQGVFLEISNAEVMVGRPYPYDDYVNNVAGKDEIENRVYFASSQDELQTILDKFGMEADPADIYAPSTHHTMGGLTTDIGRRVLDTNCSKQHCRR